MSIDGKKILLGVTGGIAAYKAVLLLRLLKRDGADVKVVMTPAATEFVTALTFEALSEHKVHVHLFASDESGATTSGGAVSPIEHIDLAKWPDLVVIAPATANTIANLVHGKADDLLSTTVSAFAGPVLLAPAMNDVMWENPANQENMVALSNRGYQVVPPESGDLACGYEATGRMAEPDTIHRAIRNRFDSPFAGVRVTVTAGGTEEDLDAVRVISNRSSGKMGFAIAAAARDLGADVTLIAANPRVPVPHGVRVVGVRTSDEMAHALDGVFDRTQVLFMAAAVSDFRAAEAMNKKRKTSDEWTVKLTRTTDILASLGSRKGDRIIVGFALETDDMEANAMSKLERKHCDVIVANNPHQKGAAFAHDTNVVTIYGATGKLYQSDGPEPKIDVARRLLDLVSELDSFKKI